MGTMRWQDWFELALGVWLGVSPWALGFTDVGAAHWNAVIAGVAIILYAIVELGVPKAWEEWVSIAIGVWLILSPFALGFYSHAVASWNTVVVGILIVVFAAWAMALDKEIGKWWDKHVTGH